MGADHEATKLLKYSLPALHVKRFRVECIEGLDVGKHAESDGDDFTIGTASGNGLQLQDQAVSRHHCLIESHGRGFLIRDLDSTNGTFVDGLRIESAFLRHAVTIRVGISHVRFSVLDETVKQELSTEQAFGEVVGASIAMRRLFAVLRRVAGSDATLLLEGETGTGKTALAEAIHRSSPRADGPFVTVDCATIPPTLIESELFGHERGAFTGADERRAGAIEQADGGTLFLDEIGELPLAMQPKLLRVIEEHTIRRLGGSDPKRVDFRAIAATNRELSQEVNRGAFRSDLYYRLNTVKVSVPPLRKHRDDIPLLIRHFARRLGAGNAAVSALDDMTGSWQKRDWPGNVRELRSAVERAILLGGDSVAQPLLRFVSSIPPAPAGPRVPGPRHDFSITFREAKASAVAEWEREYIEALLGEHDGNLSKAARAVEMDRNYLRELARRHGLL